mgnify:CR=1 FL=1
MTIDSAWSAERIDGGDFPENRKILKIVRVDFADAVVEHRRGEVRIEDARPRQVMGVDQALRSFQGGGQGINFLRSLSRRIQTKTVERGGERQRFFHSFGVRNDAQKFKQILVG